MPTRRSVDLSSYPNLVVVYLGYRASAPRGLVTLLEIGVRLLKIRATPPPGLLLHEFFLLGPLHVGFRQYWTDLESLYAFTVTGQHAEWWRTLGKDPRGGGFWHETYCKAGGIEAIYIDVPPMGLGRFAPERQPIGAHLSSGQRLGREQSGDNALRTEP